MTSLHHLAICGIHREQHTPCGQPAAWVSRWCPARNCTRPWAVVPTAPPPGQGRSGHVPDVHGMAIAQSGDALGVQAAIPMQGVLLSAKNTGSWAGVNKHRLYYNTSLRDPLPAFQDILTVTAARVPVHLAERGPEAAGGPQVAATAAARPGSPWSRPRPPGASRNRTTAPELRCTRDPPHSRESRRGSSRTCSPDPPPVS
jgi:hypothetical protein